MNMMVYMMWNLTDMIAGEALHMCSEVFGGRRL